MARNRLKRRWPMAGARYARASNRIRIFLAAGGFDRRQVRRPLDPVQVGSVVAGTAIRSAVWYNIRLFDLASFGTGGDGRAFRFAAPVSTKCHATVSDAHSHTTGRESSAVFCLDCLFSAYRCMVNHGIFTLTLCWIGTRGSTVGPPYMRGDGSGMTLARRFPWRFLQCSISIP